MKSRTASVLMLIAATSLASGWWFGLRTTPGGQTELVAGSLAFPGLTANLQQVGQVQITHAGKTATLADSNGQWGLADRGGYPIQPEKLRELLTGLTELRLAEPRTADATQYARLGGEDPQAKDSNSTLLRIVGKDGKPVAELIVGHRRVRTQGNVPESIYVRRPGEAQSWLAEGRLPVDADPQLWVRRDIASIEAAKMASVVVHRGDETLTFARNGDKFELTAPADHPKLDDFRVEDVGRAFDNLTLTEVKPAAEQPGEKVGTAVFTTTDGVKIDVAVFRADKDIWIQLAASAEAGPAKDLAEQMQAKFKGWTFQVGAWKEQAFVPTLASLKASEPAPAEAAPKPATE